MTHPWPDAEAAWDQLKSEIATFPNRRVVPNARCPRCRGRGAYWYPGEGLIECIACPHSSRPASVPGGGTPLPLYTPLAWDRGRMHQPTLTHYVSASMPRLTTICGLPLPSWGEATFVVGFEGQECDHCRRYRRRHGETFGYPELVAEPGTVVTREWRAV